MPKVVSIPKNLKAYQFHGLDLSHSEGEDEATCDCPFCGREGKFSINVETGMWRCFVCNIGTEKGGGNALSFLRLYHEHVCTENVSKLSDLATAKGFALDDSLAVWGIRYSPLTDCIVIPGYAPNRKMSQLYKYIYAGGKWLLLPTPELGHALFIPGDYNPDKPILYAHEGPWDGIAMREVLLGAKKDDEGSSESEPALSLTANLDASLYSEANVIAVPGCGSVGKPLEKWVDLFGNKHVIWMGDSDHPRASCVPCKKSWFYSEATTCPECGQDGKRQEGAGYAATKRAAEILARCDTPPAAISYLNWGPEGYDPDLPSGYDVRDHLIQGDTVKTRLQYLTELLQGVEPIPEDWIAGRTLESRKNGQVDIDLLPCNNWQALVQSWRKAMRWSEGLDKALAVMLSSITTTKIVGDQLWVKIIGPAACGKSTLCEAVSTNKKYVVAKSTMRGFHSGFKSDAAGDKDNSLIAQLYDKTLVTKDGDTLLQAPNLTQILSEARDLYDKTSRTHYRNDVSKDYQGVNMTWILCGTSGLRKIDQSELGERFLDCVIMEAIDEDEEDAILLRVANRTDRNMAIESNGDMSTQNDPALVEAMRLTGGYINYLRDNAGELLGAVGSTEQSLRTCIQLGKFVAFMRARPSKMQEETAERELATRLVSQITRLAKVLAVVMNRSTVDADVLHRARSVALDTARGRTLELVRHLYAAGEAGATSPGLSISTGHNESEEKRLLKFLSRIGVTEHFLNPTNTGIHKQIRWRLTPRLRTLYGKVMP